MGYFWHVLSKNIYYMFIREFGIFICVLSASDLDYSDRKTTLQPFGAALNLFHPSVLAHYRMSKKSWLISYRNFKWAKASWTYSSKLIPEDEKYSGRHERF